MNVQVSQVLERMKEYWDTIPQQYMVVIYLAGAVFALLNCFMGYRLRKVWGCILGILAGAGGGGVAGYYFLQDKVMALVCGAAGALIFGLLAWLLYKFGVFFMCTGLVYALILTFFEDASLTQHIIALVAGVFAGTLALGYEKQMVIGITAVCGGIGGIHLLFAMMAKNTGGELVLGIILAVIGAAVQAAPLMKGEDWEAKVFHLPSGSRKKRGGLPTGRKKKVVKKTKVGQKRQRTRRLKNGEVFLRMMIMMTEIMTAIISRRKKKLQTEVTGKTLTERRSTRWDSGSTSQGKSSRYLIWEAESVLIWMI